MAFHLHGVSSKATTVFLGNFNKHEMSLLKIVWGYVIAAALTQCWETCRAIDIFGNKNNSKV
jgi:hypothetical protein